MPLVEVPILPLIAKEIDTLLLTMVLLKRYPHTEILISHNNDDVDVDGPSYETICR